MWKVWTPWESKKLSLKSDFLRCNKSTVNPSYYSDSSKTKQHKVEILDPTILPTLLTLFLLRQWRQQNLLSWVNIPCELRALLKKWKWLKYRGMMSVHHDDSKTPTSIFPQSNDTHLGGLRAAVWGRAKTGLTDSGWSYERKYKCVS